MIGAEVLALENDSKPELDLELTIEFSEVERYENDSEEEASEPSLLVAVELLVWVAVICLVELTPDNATAPPTTPMITMTITMIDA